MKKCTKCFQEKVEALFSIRNKRTNVRRNICKPCSNAARRSSPNFGLWHKNNKDHLQKYMRNFDLKRHYGLTQDDFNQLLDSQGRMCQICRVTKPGGRGRFHIDHDHKTSKIRGLLCTNCNVMLGNSKDNVSILEQAIKYLKSS